MGRVMGLDVGTKTIGVALSDPSRLVVRPLTTIGRKGVKADVEHIAHLAREHGVEAVVVGLPLELDGSEARSARLARQVGEAVRERCGVAVTFLDERYSSVDAERRLVEAGLSRERRRQVIDQEAAALILESFLEHGDWTRDEGPEEG